MDHTPPQLDQKPLEKKGGLVKDDKESLSTIIKKGQSSHIRPNLTSSEFPRMKPDSDQDFSSKFLKNSGLRHLRHVSDGTVYTNKHHEIMNRANTNSKVENQAASLESYPMSHSKCMNPRGTNELAPVDGVFRPIHNGINVLRKMESSADLKESQPMDLYQLNPNIPASTIFNGKSYQTSQTSYFGQNLGSEPQMKGNPLKKSLRFKSEGICITREETGEKLDHETQHGGKSRKIHLPKLSLFNNFDPIDSTNTVRRGSSGQVMFPAKDTQNLRIFDSARQTINSGSDALLKHIFQSHRKNSMETTGFSERRDSLSLENRHFEVKIVDLFLM